MSKPDNYMLCSDCKQLTINSNDGGPILCHFHDTIFKGNLEDKRIPVIVLKQELFDVTHFETNKWGLESLINTIVHAYEEQYTGEKDIDYFALKLGAELEMMTKKELEEVPEV